MHIRIVSLVFLFVICFSSIACAPAMGIPADIEVDRIEIRDQEAMHSYDDMLKPTKTVTDPKQISCVLEFLRQRDRAWFPPIFETPGSRYTIGFYKGEKFQFVVWPNRDGICGRIDGEDKHDNRCRFLFNADAEEFKACSDSTNSKSRTNH